MGRMRRNATIFVAISLVAGFGSTAMNLVAGSAVTSAAVYWSSFLPGATMAGVAHTSVFVK